jgi:hypothetical protein
MKSIREVINRLLMSCGYIDDDCRVKIVRRDADNIVTHVAILPISYIDAHDNICVEESQINWRPYE